MALLYFDSSALVKLVARERESPALFELLAPRPDVVSSALARVEVLRAVARAGGRDGERQRAEAVLERLTLIAVDTMILRAASDVEPVSLRSLDAVHLASALALGDDLEEFVGYDRRLNHAARELGLPVSSPR